MTVNELLSKLAAELAIHGDSFGDCDVVISIGPNEEVVSSVEFVDGALVIE